MEKLTVALQHRQDTLEREKVKEEFKKKLEWVERQGECSHEDLRAQVKELEEQGH